MSYKLGVTGIVIFWLLMTGLLIRREFYPAQDGLQEIPPEHVLKLLFEHEQTSALIVENRGERVGTVEIRPTNIREVGEPPSRRLHIFSNFQIAFSGSEKHRVVCDLKFGLAQDFALRKVAMIITSGDREFRDYRFTADWDGQDNIINYELTTAGQVTASAHGKIEDILKQLPLETWGISADQAKLATANIQQPGLAPTVKAWLTRIPVRGEMIDACVLTVKNEQGMSIDVYVNQVGQILLVKTFLGYQFSADSDSMP